MAIERIQQMTVAEYLAYEEKSDIKHEYIDGELYPMIGGTLNHAAIMMNAGGSLWRRLGGTGCQVLSSAMRVRVSPMRYLYPDISVVCGEPATEYKSLTLLNPTLVVEITSPSTIDYDRGDKLRYYQSIASLQVCLIIDQQKPQVELVERRDSGWHTRAYADLGAALPLPALGCDLPLAEVYGGIAFEAQASRLLFG